MKIKNIRPFEADPFKGVDPNILFRLDVRTRDVPAYSSSYGSNALVWTAHNPAPDKPASIRLIDVYDAFTPTLLESAKFKVELAKWFNGVVDDILDSGEGAWDTGAVIAYFKQGGHPPLYGSGNYQPPHPGFGPTSQPFDPRSGGMGFGPTSQRFDPRSGGMG